MKKALLVFALISYALLSGCASVPMASIEQDTQAKQYLVNANSANIYLYRNETFGAAIAMPVSLDGKVAGKTSAKTYFKWSVAPGQHEITSLTENTAKIKINAVEGQNHFIWQEVKMGLWAARSQLHEVSEEIGKKGVGECKLAETEIKSNGTRNNYPASSSAIMSQTVTVDASNGPITQPVNTNVSKNINNNSLTKSPIASESADTTLLNSCSSCIGHPNCPYIDNDDGTITDIRINKTWMRCSYGQQWDGNTCTGTPIQITTPDAIVIGKKTYLANKTKWRLPYKSEFSKLLSTSCMPMINPDIFPNTPLGEYAAFHFSQTDRAAHYFNLRTGESYMPIQRNPGIDKSYVRFIHD